MGREHCEAFYNEAFFFRGEEDRGKARTGEQNSFLSMLEEGNPQRAKELREYDAAHPLASSLSESDRSAVEKELAQRQQRLKEIEQDGSEVHNWLRSSDFSPSGEVAELAFYKAKAARRTEVRVPQSNFTPEDLAVESVEDAIMRVKGSRQINAALNGHPDEQERWHRAQQRRQVARQCEETGKADPELVPKDGWKLGELVKLGRSDILAPKNGRPKILSLFELLKSKE